MTQISRRRFITVAAGAAGIACVPGKLIAARAGPAPWPSCPRTLPSNGDDEHPFVYLLVVMPDAGARGEVPDKYRPFIHVCHPPTRRPCWCGGWHEPHDPVNFVLAVGTPVPDLRVQQTARGLFILPTEAAPTPGTAMNSLKGPAYGFSSWAVRAIEQVSEPFLVPGVIGNDLADLIPILGESTELNFDFGVSPKGVMDAGTNALASARRWLAQASGLLVRITGRRDVTLEEVNTLCSAIGDAAHPDANIIFSAAIGDECVAGVMGG